MTTILLARHGETDWNRENRFQGHADPPLNDLGRAQARELGERLEAARPAAIYASPLRRAFETAEIIAARLGLPVVPIPGLREVDVGSWSGLTRAEIEVRFPDGYRRWLGLAHGWDDGETYEDLGLRVFAALCEIASRHAGERVLAVTHGGPIRAMQAHAAGVAYGEARRLASIVANGALLEFAFESGTVRRID